MSQRLYEAACRRFDSPYDDSPRMAKVDIDASHYERDVSSWLPRLAIGSVEDSHFSFDNCHLRECCPSRRCCLD